MSNNDREELEKKDTNSQIEEVDELMAISDQSIISFDNIIDELKALQLREYGDSEKRKKIKIIAEENQKRLQDAEELEQKKNKEEQAVQDNLLERQKPEQELNLILAHKRQNVSDAYTDLENADRKLEASNDFLIDATLVLAEKELNLNNSTQRLNDLQNELTKMSVVIKDLQDKVEQLLPSAETIKSEGQSELKDTTELDAQSALQKLNSEISDKKTQLADLSKLIVEQQEKCKQAYSFKDSAFAKYTEAQENHQKCLGVYKSAFEKYIGAVNNYNEGLESEQQLRIPEFKLKIQEIVSKIIENGSEDRYTQDIQSIELNQSKREEYIKSNEELLEDMQKKIDTSIEKVEGLIEKSIKTNEALLSNPPLEEAGEKIRDEIRLNETRHEPVRLATDNLQKSNEKIKESFKDLSKKADSLKVCEQTYKSAVDEKTSPSNEALVEPRRLYLDSLREYESARDEYQAASQDRQECLVKYLNALENYQKSNVVEVEAMPHHENAEVETEENAVKNAEISDVLETDVVEPQENNEKIVAPHADEESKKKEEESKKLSQEEKTALDRIAEAERFQPSSLSSQTSSSHKELDDTGDLESTKSELKKLLQETTSKYDSTVKKLSDMNYSDPFLNAFLVGRLANVRIAKFCKENELKKLIRESETMNPNDEQARVALRTRLNNFKSREECYNYTPLADLAEQGLQQIAGSANDLASYTNIYRAYNVMKSAFKNKNPDQDDDKSLNQRNSQQLP